MCISNPATHVNQVYKTVLKVLLSLRISCLKITVLNYIITPYTTEHN